MIYIRIPCTWFGYDGITLFPFILIYAEGDTERLRRHEAIHWWQQLETLVIGFAVLYLFFYLRGRLAGLDHHHAYLDIPFEREARQDEKQPKRAHWFGWARM